MTDQHGPGGFLEFVGSDGFVGWALTAAWTAGVATALFVWRLSLRITILEYSVKKNDEDTERRHKENADLLRGMQNRIDALTYFIANGRKPPFDP